MVAATYTPTSLRAELMLRERLRRRYSPDEDQLRAERSFRDYLRQAWHVPEPKTTFVPGFHIDAIADHLQAVTEGYIRNLLINVPPRHMKSLEVCVFWPSWEWIDHPEIRWLFSAYAGQLSTRDSLKCRRLIESPWYQQRWGDRYRLTSDQNAKTRYDNDRTGYRIATSVEGMGTGEGGDRIVVDDPHSASQAASDTTRESTLIWWDETMSTRGNDPDTVAKVIVMQRLHERDLSGHVLEKGGYEHLCLPAEYEPTTMVTGIGWEDPRTEPGQLLWPERFSHEAIADLKRDLGSRAAAGQLQQRPSPAEGEILKREWWRYWRPPVPGITWVLQSWDTAHEKKKRADYSVGLTLGVAPAGIYLLDLWRDQVEFPALKRAVRDQYLKWEPDEIVVENANSGKALLQELKQPADLGGTWNAPQPLPVVGFNPGSEGDKEVRVHAISPYVEGGQVFLPPPETAAWVDGFIEECATFPAGSHDDQVDTLSMAILRLVERGMARGARHALAGAFADLPR